MTKEIAMRVWCDQICDKKIDLMVEDYDSSWTTYQCGLPEISL